MKPEDKDLLLKDLCARLPYGVKVICDYSIWGGEWSPIKILKPSDITNFINDNNAEIKPYLRPMSSMTEEEKMKLSLSQIYAFTHYNEIAKMDWLNAHHFDYRGLIDKSLALSTEEFNPYV